MITFTNARPRPNTQDEDRKQDWIQILFAQKKFKNFCTTVLLNSFSSVELRTKFLNSFKNECRFKQLILKKFYLRIASALTQTNKL